MTDSQTLQTILEYVEKIDSDVQDVKRELKTNSSRLDNIGLQLARLEDDTPTIEEFDEVKERVVKLENQISKN